MTKTTPWGIPYAVPGDGTDGPGLGQAMSQQIADLFQEADDDLSMIRDTAAVIATEHDFGGYTSWPVTPELRGADGGSVDMDDHYVFDRARRLGTLILADLMIVFTSVPGGLSGDLEFRIPYEAFGTEATIGYAFIRNPKSGENQDFATCELWSDSNYVRLVSTQSGGLYDADYFDFYIGVYGEIHLHLRYEGFETWE